MPKSGPAGLRQADLPHLSVHPAVHPSGDRRAGCVADLEQRPP